MTEMISDDRSRFFFSLTPDRILDAVESAGYVCTGRCYSLNSFENRVYDLELEDESSNGSLKRNRIVAKFYRPGRWTEEQILEEHQFLLDLKAGEIPVVAPLAFPDGSTLKKTAEGEIYYALFPKFGGRAPDEFSHEQLRQVGRLIGRIHAVGVARLAPSRRTLNPQTYGRVELNEMLKSSLIPLDFHSRYEDSVEKILELSTKLFSGVPMHRVHGDCHPGNLLWSSSGAVFLDFDDMMNAPAVQDLWLLIPGRDEEAMQLRESLLEGYEEMRHFDRTQLRLIESLRALRFIHYTVWLARRWEDPAFPKAFPQFGTYRYWQDETEDLKKQVEWISKFL